MEQSFEPRGKLLARNTLLNVGGNLAPLLVGVFSIPYIIRGLGTAGFGILSIAWVFLAYLSFLDLGFGVAATKYVAECIGRNEKDEIPQWVWTSIELELVFGVIGALIIGAATPFVVDHVLKISPVLRHDAKVSFILLGASLPVVLVTNGLRAVLVAAQRFDLINAVRVPVNISIFLLPAIALPFGFRLPGIILLLVLARIAGAVAILMLVLAVFPSLRSGLSFNPKLIRPLASFGGWSTISNVLGSLQMYIDRLVIGAVVSVAAVSYYAAPSEVITRAGFLLPSSLMATLFPAFSNLDASGARERITDFFVRSLKLLLLVLGPTLLTVAIFAHPILRFWLGENFAARSSSVLQILAAGVLINALSSVPYCLLPGVGRPDVPAKLHLVEFPVYTVMLWFFVRQGGVIGAAFAWTLGMALYGILLYAACYKIKIIPFRFIGERHFLRSVAAVLGLALGFLITLAVTKGLLARGFFSCLLLSIFGIGAWAFALDDADRSLLASAVGRVSGVVGGTR